MPFDDHVKRGHPIIFGLLAFFSFIEIVQTGVLVGSYNRNNDYPTGSIRDRTRFLLFVSLWTFFFAFFYLFGFLRASGSFLFSIASHGSWLALTWIFWLAGAAAITNALGGGLSCGSLPVGFGHCHQLNSAEAFAWINWILITVAFGAVLFLGARSARGGNGFGGALV